MSEHDWYTTASGIAFLPLAPRMEDIRIEDIAHALAATNRFNGHARVPYSVAQHSVLVSRALRDGGGTRQDQLHGLLHDAAEAYLCDVPRPLKRRPEMAAYREAEARLQAMIYARFGLPPEEPASLKLVDRRMLRTEQRDLMPPSPLPDARPEEPYAATVVPWTFEAARMLFHVMYSIIHEDLSE